MQRVSTLAGRAKRACTHRGSRIPRHLLESSLRFPLLPLLLLSPQVVVELQQLLRVESEDSPQRRDGLSIAVHVERLSVRDEDVARVAGRDDDHRALGAAAGQVLEQLDLNELVCGALRVHQEEGRVSVKSINRAAGGAATVVLCLVALYIPHTSTRDRPPALCTPCDLEREERTCWPWTRHAAHAGRAATLAVLRICAEVPRSMAPAGEVEGKGLERDEGVSEEGEEVELLSLVRVR